MHEMHALGNKKCIQISTGILRGRPILRRRDDFRLNLREKMLIELNWLRLRTWDGLRNDNE